jgi:glutaconate CoA-transferase subunit A
VSKVIDLRSAVAEFVHDGDVVALGGFTHLIPFAAGHEIIRQRKVGLTLCRLTPDVVADQLVAAGCVSKLVFSWMGNPGVGSLHAIRRRVEAGEGLELEEYSHFGMVCRYVAGAARLPFFPIRSYAATDLPRVNPRIVEIASPYGDETVFAVPPLNPDVAIIHVQRATEAGDAQVWGLVGCQSEEAFASARVVVTCEEVVPDEVVRADPNRTLIPGLIVDAVVPIPRGCHPSYAQGHYDRDNRFYRAWDEISRDPDRLAGWLDEWVLGTADHEEYVARLGAERWRELTPAPAPSGSVDYGAYR